MRIGELASRAGCDVETVRFYEREGLLEEPPRESSGYRRYSGRHLTRLAFIRHSRSLDIPLPEVRKLLAFAETGDPACHDVDALLDTHLGMVRRRIEALTALEGQLVALRQTCDGDRSHPCTILESFVAAGEREACACHATSADAHPGALPSASTTELPHRTASALSRAS